jgi:hypothetical protein
MDTFSGAEMTAVAYNSMRRPFLEWLEEEELKWDNSVMQDRASWETDDAGVYEGLFQKLSTTLVKVRWKFSDEAL